MNMTSQMRQLLAKLIVFQTPSDHRTLLEDFKKIICDDYIRHDKLNDPEITF